MKHFDLGKYASLDITYDEALKLARYIINSDEGVEAAIYGRFIEDDKYVNEVILILREKEEGSIMCKTLCVALTDDCKITIGTDWFPKFKKVYSVDSPTFTSLFESAINKARQLHQNTINHFLDKVNGKES